MGSTRSSTLAVLGLTLTLAPGAALAGGDGLWPNLEEHWFDRLPIEVQHPPRRPDGFLGSWWVTGALAATWAGLEFGADPPTNPRWSSQILFDEDARDGLRAGTSSGRDDAGLASDALLIGLVSWIFLVDTALVRDWEVQRELWKVNLDALFANLAATRLLKVTVGRKRPFVADCALDPGSNEDCDDSDTFNAAFYSGHASTAGTMAGLACAHHIHGDIFGGWKDAAVCGGAAGAALATGMLRVVADDHHMTDVIVGWASGLAFGYVLPRWLYYDNRGRARSTLIVPTASRGGAGLLLVKRF